MEAIAVGILDDDQDVETKSTGVLFPVWMLERFEEIAKKRGKSRNWVIVRLAKVGLEVLDREESAAAARGDELEKPSPKKKG